MKIINGLLGLFLILFLVSCRSGRQKGRYTLDYISYEDKENDRYGLLGADGKCLFTNLFEESTTSVVNEYFAIEEDEGLALCKLQNGSYVKVAGSDGLSNVGVMNDALIPVCKDYEHIKIIDGDGRLVFTLGTIRDIEALGCYSYSSERLRVLLMDGTYVYLDRQGNVLFDKTYDYATDFQGGYAVINIDDETFALIDKLGSNIFTFYSKDTEKIVFSTQFERLATSDKDDRIIVYNFKGEIMGIYPSKVEGVYALGENSFIFLNDEEFGLMAYTGEELIRAKYEQLVPNGNDYLAIHSKNDEEVKIIDEHENVLGKLDGEEIYDLRAIGYTFPNIIKRSDDEIYLVDLKGDIIGKGAQNNDFDIDDIKNANQVRNQYFPQDEVLSTVMNLCGSGNGIPNDQGLYFYKNGNHCCTTDVYFLKKEQNVAQYRDKYSASILISQGVNFLINFGVTFDEPIVGNNADALSTSAWLESMTVTISVPDMFLCTAFFNVCKNELIDHGCTLLYSKNNDYILLSNDQENLLVIRHDMHNNRFYITLNKRTEDNISKWKKILNVKGYS